MKIVHTDPLASIPKWFRDHSPTMDDARLATLRSCVLGLADAEADEPGLTTLVAAAYGEVTEADLAALDDLLVACTPTYAADRHRDELCTMAAAAAIVLMSADRMNNGSDGHHDAVVTALLVESAAFTGRVPVVDDLAVAAKECLSRSSSSARARLSNDTTVRAVARLKKVEADDELTPDLERIHELVLERDKAINAMAARIEQLVASFNQRLDLLDEELDVLWWARSSWSSTLGERWTDLSALDRAVVATQEVSGMVKFHPSTFGTRTVLASIVDSTEPEYGIVEVLGALDRNTVKLSGDTSTFLTPLASGLAMYRQFNGAAEVVGSALEAARIFTASKYSAEAVAEQLLREWSIEALG